MNTCTNTFQYHLYIPRPIYINRNDDKNHINNNVRGGIEGDKYLLLAFFTDYFITHSYSFDL